MNNEDEIAHVFANVWQENAVRIGQEVSPVFKTLQQSFESIAPTMLEAQKVISQALQKLQMEWLEKLLSTGVLDLGVSQEKVRELPDKIRNGLLLLGEHGWYMDLEMSLSDLWRPVKALSEGKIQEADEVMAQYLEDRLAEIEESISKKFPNREKLIRAAFRAHRKQEYDLSIPVLLAQADGICKERTGGYFFQRWKGKRKPQTAIYVEQMKSDLFMGPFLSPLAQALPIGASESDRPEGFDELNRHMVLHGESLHYGTKKNGLKAISLTNYVAHVFDKKNQVRSVTRR